MYLKAPSFKLLLLLFFRSNYKLGKVCGFHQKRVLGDSNQTTETSWICLGRVTIWSQVPMFEPHAYFIVYYIIFRTKFSNRKKWNLDLMEDVSRILWSVWTVIRADCWYLLEHRWHSFSSKTSPKVSENISMNNPVWLLSHNPQAWENLKLPILQDLVLTSM